MTTFRFFATCFGVAMLGCALHGTPASDRDAPEDDASIAANDPVVVVSQHARLP